MKLIAIQEVYYASRTRKPGETFEASDVDGRILKGIGKAKDAPASPVHRSDELTTRHIEPEKTESLFTPSAEPPAEPIKSQQPQRRRYTRRDMTAED